MSINKYSIEYAERLGETLQRILRDVRNFKLEDKAHHTAIKDGAFRVIDADNNVRVKMGKKDTGVYGFIVYDSEGGIVMEATDDAITGLTSISVQATAPESPADKDVWMDI